LRRAAGTGRYSGNALMTSHDKPFEEIYFTARDGLRLYGRRYPGARGRRARPVLCLAGLTRNSRDFHDLATALSQHPDAARTVYTMDYRGRGFSDFDPDWKNYAVPVEMFDVLDFMTLTGIESPAIIGTSRGGLIAMAIAAVQPTALGAVIMNDIGPVIQHDGLVRISGYVGRVPLPISWPDAARMVRDLNRRHFPEIPESEWEAIARQWYNERNGRPAPGYDTKLGKALSVLYRPLPPLWPQFEALKHVPMLVVRGENSDVLAESTVDEMRRRHPALATITVANQGHAPLLKDAPTIEAIRHFLVQTEINRGAGVRLAIA
jgi:pimeloyl-ACP methyl ester carboxylesterase